MNTRHFLKLSCIAVLMISFAALAAEEPTGNFTKGHYMVGGSASMSHDSSSSLSVSYTSLTLSLPLQYFVIDRLALGGTFSLSHFESSGATFNTFGVGPAATYYFWNYGKLALFGAENLAWTKSTGSKSQWVWSNTLGLDYFFVPQVSIGPALNYTHRFTDDVVFNNSFSAFVNFRIFL